MKIHRQREHHETTHLFSKGLIHCDTDEEGKIVYINHRFTLITGYEKEELIGKSCDKLLLATNPQKIRDHIIQRIRAGKSWEGLLRFSRKDGRYFWADTQVSPLLKGEGTRHVAYLGRPADPEEIRERELELKRMINGIESEE
jgi:PAS domain S-box-containing protein